MKATFAAGCFWHVEDLFRKVKGVSSAEVGYTGGWFENPTYEGVCTDKTGHAEAVEVEYDPWNNHNPTTPNRQGPDIENQYRSSIFVHDKEQEAAAKESKERVNQSGKFGNGRIVTEIKPASKFYKAEEYHQQYFQKCGLTH